MRTTMNSPAARRHGGKAMMGRTPMNVTLVAVAALGLAACAAPQPAGQPPQPSQARQQATQVPDRSTRPAVGEAPDVVLPAVHEFTLANGLRVLVLEKRDLPLVQFNLLVDAGAARDVDGRIGLASMTAAMLDEGAAGRTALEIADAFEMLGARFGIGADLHRATLTLRVPAARLPEALGLAADVLLRPDFPAEELERLRLDRLTTLVRQHDQPSAVAAVLVDRTLFGTTHPYGRGGFGTEASLRAMTTAELRSFHQRYYRPGNATAIVVGDIDAATARRLLEQSLGGWERGADVAPLRLTDAPQVSGRRVFIVNMPGSAQSVVTLGRIGVPRSTRDYYALEVMNVILGGSFTSRLNQNLREDKGYTYGARSAFDFRPVAGPWTAGAAVQTQSTGPALLEFMNELRAMHQPIPDDEVDRARNFLAMRYPAGFQSVAGIAARLANVVDFGLPPTYFNEYVDNVLAVTRADVERVARQYIDPENVTIFVVGDRAAIEQQVRDQNLGDIIFHEVTDVLGTVPVL
jgi:zinc protease